jgi:hypothetical protein
MVQQAQLGPLVQALSSQLGINPQELEERGRQSRLTMAATVAAARSNCACDACQLLRQFSDKLVSDALHEVSPGAPGPDPQP